MGQRLAAIDWYADGFEVRVEGTNVLAMPATLLAILGGFGTLVFGVGVGLSQGTAEGVLVLVGWVSFTTACAIVAGVARDRPPVRRVVVDGHRLKVEDGAGKRHLDVLLEEVRGVDLIGSSLEIGHQGGVFKMDASAQLQSSLEPVVDALRAAVAVRKQPESEADRARREQALEALQALRSQA